MTEEAKVVDDSNEPASSRNSRAGVHVNPGDRELNISAQPRKAFFKFRRVEAAIGQAPLCA